MPLDIVHIATGMATGGTIITLILLLIRWLRRDLNQLRDDLNQMRGTVFDLAREISEMRGKLDLLVSLLTRGYANVQDPSQSSQHRDGCSTG